jgi:hypothetical protein
MLVTPRKIGFNSFIRSGFHIGTEHQGTDDDLLVEAHFCRKQIQLTGTTTDTTVQPIKVPLYQPSL